MSLLRPGVIKQHKPNQTDLVRDNGIELVLIWNLCMYLEPEKETIHKGKILVPCMMFAVIYLDLFHKMNCSFNKEKLIFQFISII